MAKMSKNEAHLWIHTWSAAHAITATATAQSPDGGLFILTAETVAAVITISQKCGSPWTKSFAEAFVKQQLANRAGTEILRQTAGKIPLAGNALNGVISLAVTEAILWETYHQCTKT